MLITQEYNEIEREYESEVKVIDETYSSAMITFFEFYQKVFSNYQLGFGIPFLFDGTNKAKHDTSLSIPNSTQKDINSLGNLFLEIIKEVDSSNNAYNHYLRSKIVFSYINEEHLYFDDRKFGLFSYIFSHTNNYWLKINGEIFTRYFARIQTDKKVVGNEKREAFTDVGMSIYPTIKINNVILTPLLGFSLSTDYNTHNNFFSRITDKGFSYFGGMEISYIFNNFTYSFEYYSSSFVFNSITDGQNQDIDNEIEKRSFKLKIGVNF